VLQPCPLHALDALHVLCVPSACRPCALRMRSMCSICSLHALHTLHALCVPSVCSICSDRGERQQTHNSIHGCQQKSKRKVYCLQFFQGIWWKTEQPWDIPQYAQCCSCLCERQGKKRGVSSQQCENLCKQTADPKSVSGFRWPRCLTARASRQTSSARRCTHGKL
jgi:hypothetical protein